MAQAINGGTAAKTGGRRILSTLLAAVIAATSLTVVTAPVTATQAEARERHHGHWKKRPRYVQRRDDFRRPFYSDRRWDRHHHRRYYHRRHNNNGAMIGAGIAGLAAGAILGGALASPSYSPPRVTYNSAPAAGGYAPGSRGWVRYCSAKYRSFDPQSGTYLGYDGYRHYCQ